MKSRTDVCQIATRPGHTLSPHAGRSALEVRSTDKASVGYGAGLAMARDRTGSWGKEMRILEQVKRGYRRDTKNRRGVYDRGASWQCLMVVPHGRGSR